MLLYYLASQIWALSVPGEGSSRHVSSVLNLIVSFLVCSWFCFLFWCVLFSFDFFFYLGGGGVFFYYYLFFQIQYTMTHNTKYCDEICQFDTWKYITTYFRWRWVVYIFILWHCFRLSLFFLPKIFSSLRFSLFPVRKNKVVKDTSEVCFL